MENYEIVDLNFVKQSSCSFFTPDQLFSKKSLKYQINYNLSFKSVTYKFFSSQDSVDFVSALRTTPVVHKSFQLNFEQGSNCPTRRKTIRRELVDLPEEMNLEWVIEKIVRKTNRMIKFKEAISMKHNVFNVDVDVIHKVHYTVFESVEWMNRILGWVMRNSVSFMIPATDLSIKSLERKSIACDSDGTCQSCSICLEDFIQGCQVSCMPCSHPFHVNCIEMWLKTSHYCPICRFQMPKK